MSSLNNYEVGANSTLHPLIELEVNILNFLQGDSSRRDIKFDYYDDNAVPLRHPFEPSLLCRRMSEQRGAYQGANWWGEDKYVFTDAE